MRIRELPCSNYKATFCNGHTFRFAIDPAKEITEIPWPEFYDVALNTKCKTGRTKILQKDGSRQNCFYCYAASSLNGEYFPDVASRVRKFFEQMDLSQRPFQWAIGGSGEPLEHPEFWSVCEVGVELDIVPNYTTNGMLVTDEVVSRTKELCGGAAVTCHDHMEPFWRRAIRRFEEGGVKINLHHIVSDKESIDKFAGIYREYKNCVDYFVLLPYMNTGHAMEFPRVVDYAYLEAALDEVFDESKIAFGANMYEWLVKKQNKYGVSLYPPEIFSKYAVFDGDTPSLYNNSFDMTPVSFDPQTGIETEKVKQFTK
jgi:hypothetical protein